MKRTKIRANSTKASPLWRGLIFILIMLTCIALWSKAQTLSPPPDGGYPGGNTAEGTNALQNLEFVGNQVGFGNTAVGWYSLFTNSTGSYSTAIGAGALALNTADENTAVGAGALLLNNDGLLNTAVGTNALVHNLFGSWNCAFGVLALAGNRAGGADCAFGTYALAADNSNLELEGNSAFGFAALEDNLDGFINNAFGAQALQYNVHGYANNAFGLNALYSNDSSGTGLANANNGFGDEVLYNNVDGAANVAIGDSAFHDNVNGSFNTVVGYSAGVGVEGSDNIYIGATSGPQGGGSESQTIRVGDPQLILACYIAGVSGQTATNGSPVFIDSDGKLGTLTSSARFKDDIKPMNEASETLYSLKPVSFRYKKEIDPAGTSQLGLVAEDVEKVTPALVVHDKAGKPYSVRYDQVNAMLLNEFLKEHRKVEQLEKQVEALSAGLQKVSAQLEMSKSAPQTVLNNQ